MVTEHYFSESPASDTRVREIEVSLAGAPRQVVTAGGVFSPEHLDRGTEILLRSASDHPTLFADGAVLDLGCGWGPIALSAALAAPEREVWAIDINERARDLTAQNAQRLHLTNVRVEDPQRVPTSLRFQTILSNPPIRIGKAALHELLRQWLPRLAPGGSALLVVAKHLGAESLQRWIASEFPMLQVTRIARDKGFHVIEAVRVTED